MEEIVDGTSLETIGYCLNSEEKNACLFALNFYGRALEINPFLATDNYEHYAQAKGYIDTLKGELEDGIDTILPDSYVNIGHYFLHFLYQVHLNTNSEAYQTVCEMFEVTAFDLFYNAFTAKEMLDRQSTTILLA